MRPSRQMQSFIRPWPGGRLSAKAILIAAFVASSVFQWLSYGLNGGDAFETNPAWRAALALSAAGIRTHHYWQFLSYGFLHAGFFHLACNMCLLFLAAREVEPIVGRRHFLGVFCLGYLAGGIAQWSAVAAHLAIPFALLGASSGVATVIAAYATILPELELDFRLFFLWPVRIRTKAIGLVTFGVALISCVADAPQAAPMVMAATAGHWFQITEALYHVLAAAGPASVLAGMAVGWAYMKFLGYGNPLAIQRFLYNRRQRAERMARMPAEQFISEEIDPILEKISEQGMHSLSRTERRILEQGREKIGSAVSVKRSPDATAKDGAGKVRE